MAKVSLVLTDQEDGSVHFLIDKGEMGEDMTPAQNMALIMLSALEDDEGVEEED